MHSLRYRPDIDALRAVAVLAVLIYHALPAWLPGGFVGVDVFFVISGYLITSILAAEHATTGRIDFLAFYARRARRLLPALLVIVVATVGLALLLVPTGPFVHDVIESAWASLVFAGNVYFQFASGGYFDGPADELPLLHLWSLGVEEQFYLVHPLVLLAALRLGRKSAARVLWVLALASLVLAEYALGRWPDAAFYQMPPRLWELAAGALVALSAPRLRSGWLAVAGLGLILYAAVSPATWFPGIGALPPVLGAALFLLAVHGGLAMRWPRPLLTVGKWSYGVYLWHWPLMAIDRALTFDEPPAWRLLTWCALAIVLAGLSHRFIEAPALRRLAVRPSRQVVRLAGAAIALALAVGLAAHRLHEPRPGLAQVATMVQRDKPAIKDRCHFLSTDEVKGLIGCRSSAAEPTIAVWGDSHALAWSPFVWELARSRGASATLISMDACPPLARFTGTLDPAPSYRVNCAKMNALALDVLPKFDTVVIASHWLSHAQQPSMLPAAEFDAGLDAALDTLASVRQVMLILPAYVLPEPAAKCILTMREPECGTSRREAEAARAGMVARLKAVTARHPNVVLVDPLPFFCGDDCPVRKGEMPIFWDDDHISASAARGFAGWYLTVSG